MTYALIVRPDRMMPIKRDGQIEYVNVTGKYTLHFSGLSLDEARSVIDQLDTKPEQINQTPDAPPLPPEFARRIDFD